MRPPLPPARSTPDGLTAAATAAAAGDAETTVVSSAQRSSGAKVVAGAFLLVAAILVSTILLSRVQVGVPVFSRRPALELAGSLAVAGGLLALRGWPFGGTAQRAFLRWVLTHTFTRGCPDWYAPFATREGAYWLERCASTLVANVAAVLVIHAVPSTWRLSARICPKWLAALLDVNGDGAISAREFEGAAGLVVHKIFLAVLFMQIGRMVLRLKDPKPKDVDYWMPSDATSAVKGAGLIWVPVMRLIAMQRVQQPEHPSWVFLVDKFTSVAVYTGTAALWLNVVGMELRAVLAVGGVASLAIALAAKTLAQNLITGLLIYATKSITPGMEITLMNKKISGIVDTVGWFHTEICDYDGIIVIVPNGEVFENIVANKSDRRVRVCDQEFLVTLPDQGQFRDMMRNIQERLQTDPNIVQSNEIKRIQAKFKGHLHAYGPQIVVASLTDQGVKLRVRAYFRNSLKGNQFLECQSALLLDVNQRIAQLGGHVGPPRFLAPNNMDASRSAAKGHEDTKDPSRGSRKQAELEDAATRVVRDERAAQ